MDIVKGIGIILVVLGHVTNEGHLIKFIYSFHMPLFFFISGHFASLQDENNSAFITKKVKTILLPYLIFYLLTYLYWLLVERNLRSGVTGLVIEWWYPLYGLIYGISSNNSMINNTVLWFLPCLFSVSILYYFLRKTINRNVFLIIYIIIISIIGYFFFNSTITSNLRLPYSLDVALIALLFYGTGNLFYNSISNLMAKKWNWNLIVLFIIASGILIVLSQWNSVNMMAGTYGNLFLFVAGAATGIFVIYALANMINKSPILEYLGQNSLLILVLHGPLLRVIIYFSSKLFTISILEIKANLFYSLIVSILAICILIPFIELVNKKFPFLLGKFSTTSKKIPVITLQ